MSAFCTPLTLIMHHEISFKFVLFCNKGGSGLCLCYYIPGRQTVYCLFLFFFFLLENSTGPLVTKKKKCHHNSFGCRKAFRILMLYDWCVKPAIPFFDAATEFNFLVIGIARRHRGKTILTTRVSEISSSKHDNVFKFLQLSSWRHNFDGVALLSQRWRQMKTVPVENRDLCDTIINQNIPIFLV